MSDDNSLPNTLRAMILKAQRSIRSAEKQLNENDYDFGTSRAYYAVFYALEAALLSKGFVLSKHSGVIRGFSKHFVKTGVFPKEFGKLVNRLSRDRQVGDYDYAPIIRHEKARDDLEIATRIVQAITDYLVREALIDSLDTGQDEKIWVGE